MPRYLIHRDGAWNVWSTIVDAPLYDTALSAAELEAEIREEFGSRGVEDLPERMERARKFGCSSVRPMSLEECVGFNRAGPGESELPVGELLDRFLTLPKPDPAPSAGP